MANWFELTEHLRFVPEVGLCCVIHILCKFVTKAPVSVLLLKVKIILDKTYLSHFAIGMSEFSSYMTTSFLPFLALFFFPFKKKKIAALI